MDRKCGMFLIICSIICIAISGCHRHSVWNGPAKSVRSVQIENTGPEVSAECIVTFFGEEDSKYISRHRHTIYPEDMAIKVEADEPEGNFGYRLYNGDFSLINGGSSQNPVALYSSEIARAIVLSVSARGGFLGDKAGSSRKRTATTPGAFPTASGPIAGWCRSPTRPTGRSRCP